MPNLRTLFVAARVVAIVLIAAVLIKVAPNLASQAAGHSGTYSAARAQ